MQQPLFKDFKGLVYEFFGSSYIFIYFGFQSVSDTRKAAKANLEILLTMKQIL
jgi:hypothetical protein